MRQLWIWRKKEEHVLEPRENKDALEHKRIDLEEKKFASAEDEREKLIERLNGGVEGQMQILQMISSSKNTEY